MAKLSFQKTDRKNGISLIFTSLCLALTVILVAMIWFLDSYTKKQEKLVEDTFKLSLDIRSIFHTFPNNANKTTEITTETIYQNDTKIEILSVKINTPEQGVTFEFIGSIEPLDTGEGEKNKKGRRR
ncbi:hypothetical protein [Kosmotoga olearia]|uniref:hypothetical protein n=1 Tax=Kosmotoga olearia TaxID=651457 RepID=UPI0002ED69F7|nr:hypothetical protein [Kosmotoga olearia]